MGHGFFQYLRLKLIVILIRLMVPFKTHFPLKRDRALADSYGIKHERIRIPSRYSGRFIAADIYYPPGYTASWSLTAKLPVLINWHGSGFIIPMLGTDYLYLSRIARDTGMVVIDADYSKGPERPFPAAIEDVEDVLRFVTSQPKRFDVDRICVSGFSAGATLALAASSAVKKTLRDDFTIKAVTAIYPATDLLSAPEEKSVPSPINAIPPFMFHLFFDSYAPNKSVRGDPCISPALADPADYPPTVIMVSCDGDTLMPEARALAEKLDDGKRRVVNHTVKGVPHGFDKGCQLGTKEWDGREEAYALVVKNFKDAIKK